MKKKKIALICLAVLAAVLIAVLSITGRGNKIKTELPMKNIKSMVCTEMGDMFILSDEGLRRYDLGGDKKLEYIYDKNDLSEAVFEWNNNGEDIVYTGLYIDRLMAQGPDGLTMIGKYVSNDLGKNTDLFVLQDAADLNYSAAFFTEINETDGDFVNGAATDGYEIYYKLNVEDPELAAGYKFGLIGQNVPYDLPDGISGAIAPKEIERPICFLRETSEIVELVEGDSVIISYPRSEVADAFVSGDSVYVIYKDGRVTKTGLDGEEKEFKKLKDKVSTARDSVLYDGELYWVDNDGVKTSA